MLDIGYFLKIAKIISQQEKPMCTVLTAKIISRKNTKNR